MKTRTRFAVAALAALLVPLAAWAIGQGRIYGKVVDEKGAPLAGVKITVTTSAMANFKMEGTTNDRGEYAFTLKLNTATPTDPSLLDRIAGRTASEPVVFQMTLPWISEQQLGFRRATIAMHAKDWKPTVSAGK